MIIGYPRKKSEFEYHPELMFYLRHHGYHVRGEVPCKNKEGRSRVDLVIFQDGEAVCLIEVKDTPHNAVVKGGRQTRQSRKYRAFELPLIYHTSETSLEQTLYKVMANINLK